MQGETDVEAVKARTMEMFGLTRDEVDYITPELLAMPAQDVADLPAEELDGELPEEHGDARAASQPLPANRVWYISEIHPGFDGQRTNITFFRDCNRTQQYVMWSDQYRSWLRDGTCGVGGGRYVYRFKLFWRA